MISKSRWQNASVSRTIAIEVKSSSIIIGFRRASKASYKAGTINCNYFRTVSLATERSPVIRNAFSRRVYELVGFSLKPCLVNLSGTMSSVSDVNWQHILYVLGKISFR